MTGTKNVQKKIEVRTLYTQRPSDKKIRNQDHLKSKLDYEFNLFDIFDDIKLMWT